MESRRALEFRLLGSCAAYSESGAEVRFSNRKILQLAALLAYKPGSVYDRNWLATTIWGDSDPVSALASLRNALATMKRDFEKAGIPAEKVVSADKTRVSLSSAEVGSDTFQLLALLSDAKSKQAAGSSLPVLAEALRLMEQPLAPQLQSEWAVNERLVIENLRLQCMTETVEVAQKQGQSAEVADLIVAASVLDPDNEVKAQLAIKVLSDSDRHAEAVRHYRNFERTLRERLSLTPSSHTVALAREARNRSTGARDMPPGNLPEFRAPYFGRESDLELLSSMIRPAGERHRIVTIIGPGGVGKTRTAVEAASLVAKDYRDAVWIVDLSAVVAMEDVLVKTVETLCGEFDAANPLQTLGQVLTRPCLVVMDNLEQIEPGVAGVLTRLLTACPTLQILATSRRSIGAPGEVSVRLGPLPVPQSERDAAESPSIQLFIDRAKEAAMDFVPGDLRILSQLVRRLEGMPLAICLAAAKADILTPEQTLSELDGRFELLQTENSDWPERHKKLWACIDWSYKLVPESHGVLKQLSAFRGGWTTQLAEWAMPGVNVRSALQSLLRSSLVFESSRQNQVRFDMFQSVREFVQETMSDAEVAASAEGHADAVRAWVKDAQQKGQSYNSGYIADRSAEYENFRTAFDWGLKHDPRLSLNIANSLSYYWWSREMCRDGQQWLQAAIDAVPEVPSVELAMGHRALATMYIGVSDYEPGLRELEKGLDLLPGTTDPVHRARYLNSMGNALMRMGQCQEALKYFETGLRICEQAGESQVMITFIGNTGFANYLAGNLELAEEWTQKAIKLLESGDNDDWLASYWHNFGLIARVRGHYELAEERFATARAIHEDTGVDPATKSWLIDAGIVALRLGKLTEALDFIKRSARGVANVKGDEQLAECIQAAAEYCEVVGDLEEAVALLSVVVRAKDPPQRSAADKSPTAQERLDRLKSAMDRPRYRTAQARYNGLSLKDVLEEVTDLRTLSH